MGREIRRVVPNWEHPRREYYSDGRYQPMFDEDFETAAAEWKRGFSEFEAGTHSACSDDDSEFWEAWATPPDRDYYRPKWSADEATWFQVYETVSEGSPVTPPFETQEELIEYLAERGDFWDQERGDGRWLRANAEQFVKRGSAPSMVVIDGKIKTARDGI